MASSTDSGNAQPAVSRLWGSELLLRKVSIYAQARHYAAVNAADPQTECNTLAYGVSSYPLLAAVRASYNAVNDDDVATAGRASSLAPDAELVDRSAFCGIDRAGYAHVPAQRKWMAASALAADVAASTAAQSSAIVRRAAAAAVLDDAAGPPTLAEVTEPWFGLLEDRLSAEAQQAQQPTTNTVDRADAGASAAEDADGQNGEAKPEAKERFIDPDAVRVQRRKRLHDRERETRGAVYTKLEGALMHYGVAAAAEKELLRAVRVVGSDASGGVNSADRADAVSTATAVVPPETWGTRMLSLVTSTVAAEGGPRSEEEVEQQQKVLAYLKRVRWITTQWKSSTDPAALKDASATASWSQLTEASRVKLEMTHTQGQRRRFRRSRRGADGGEDSDAVEE